MPTNAGKCRIDIPVIFYLLFYRFRIDIVNINTNKSAMLHCTVIGAPFKLAG